jgi:hypothetical protein
MDKGRVGGDRGSKETDGCPLTDTIISISERAMSGRQHSKQTEVSLNH